MAVFYQKIIDLVFIDIGLPDFDGIDLIGWLKKKNNDVEIVMLTGRNDATTAVQALKAGAVDYILKPFKLIEFKKILHRIMSGRLAAKKEFVASSEEAINTILGVSSAMQSLRAEIETAAAVKAPVLIIGETGTGKELVARSIHAQALIRKGIFVKVDCGTLAASVIE